MQQNKDDLTKENYNPDMAVLLNVNSLMTFLIHKRQQMTAFLTWLLKSTVYHLSYLQNFVANI